MGWLLDPLQYAFFRNGVIVATVAGALCGLIGTFVVLRGMSYIGHGLSHAIFGGFAVSTVLAVNLFLGAGLWGFLSAMGILAVTKRRAIGADAAIGVITTASYAFGVALLKAVKGPSKSFDALLFGNVLGVGTAEIWRVVAVTVVVVAVVFLRYRRLLFTTFDPVVADASGVSGFRSDAILMVMLSASVLVTMNVIGVTLVAAAIVLPPTVARLLTDSFGRMLGLSTALGAVFGFVGMLASFHIAGGEVPSGSMIVLVGSAAFVVALVAAGSSGRAAPAGH